MIEDPIKIMTELKSQTWWVWVKEKTKRVAEKDRDGMLCGVNNK